MPDKIRKHDGMAACYVEHDADTLPPDAKPLRSPADAARLALFDRLARALEPLAKLDIGDDLTPDDDRRMVVGIAGTYIRYGDVRNARALLGEARKLKDQQ